VFFYDPYFLLFIALPFLGIGLLAQWRVKSAVARGSQIGIRRGLSGAQVAQAILDANHIDNVRIEPVQGYLSDHYDPKHKVLRLSPDVYSGRSVAAAGVAAHEVGHALQDARGYAPLVVRNAVVPVANIGSGIGMTLAMIGVAMALPTMAALGAILFAGVVVFQVVNLPVEFNASSRARETLVATGIISPDEDHEVAKVLNAAAMTYVAATIQAIATLIYFLWRSGLIGGRRD
jgi:Zn-dependent membrane protease YugP